MNGSNGLEWAIVALTGFIVSGAATRALIPWLRSHQFVDIATDRSSHTTPTPRGGGLGIVLGLIVALAVAAVLGGKLPSAAVIAGALVIAAMGLADDRRDLGAGVRLVAQIAVAAAVVGWSGGLSAWPAPEPLARDTGALAVPLGVVWIVAVINFNNFLDGIDGYAGIQCVIAATTLALAFPGTSVASLGWALAGAGGGFLLWNWRPAKVFMGDVGSYVIGFLLAAAPFELPPADRAQGVLVAALALWFFLADGTYTLMRRLLRGEQVWKPHRTHLYQRLVITGLRHDAVAAPIAAAATLVAAAALSAHRVGRPSAQWFALGAAATTFVVLILWVLYRERLKASGETPASTQFLSRGNRLGMSKSDSA